MYQSAIKHANLGLHPVYFYQIDFAGRDTWSNLFAAGGKPINFVFSKYFKFIYKIRGEFK